jgi:hypothetical protein
MALYLAIGRPWGLLMVNERSRFESRRRLYLVTVPLSAIDMVLT